MRREGHADARIIEYTQNTARIYPEYSQNIPRIHPEYIQNTARIYRGKAIKYCYFVNYHFSLSGLLIPNVTDTLSALSPGHTHQSGLNLSILPIFPIFQVAKALDMRGKMRDKGLPYLTLKGDEGSIWGRGVSHEPHYLSLWGRGGRARRAMPRCLKYNNIP